MKTELKFPWEGALDITEQINLRGINNDHPQINGRAVSGESQNSTSVIIRWREALGQQFKLFLEAYGLTETKLAEILEKEIKTNSLPSWAIAIEDLLQSRFNHNLPDTPIVSESELYELLVVPWFRQGQKYLSDVLTRIQTRFPEVAISSDQVLKSLEDSLLEQLTFSAARVVMLEFHIAQMQGKITGDSEQVRMKAFRGALCSPQTLSTIFSDYPVLARYLSLLEWQWRRGSTELLIRLSKDWTLIKQKFFSESAPGELEHIEFTGDCHQGGRRVAVMYFSTGAKLVYKPRAIDVFEHFQDLLRWLNLRDYQPAFKPIRSLNRRGYGWIEFISADKCKNVSEISRFYKRTGSLLALAELLRLNDLHYENIVAQGEYPQIIDVETLFSRLDHQDFSVMQTGLLPHPGMIIGAKTNLDISGIGALEEQDSGVQILSLHQDTEKTIAMPIGRHRPSLVGEKVELCNYLDVIRAGYQNMYYFIVKHKIELAGENGPIEAFENDLIRVLVRKTEHYSRLLFDSLHPDCLQNALRRDRQLLLLWREPLRFINSTSVLTRETRDLRRGDIPYFSIRVGQRELLDSDGQKVGYVFSRSPLDPVKQRLELMSDKDFAQREWQLKAGLKELSANPFICQEKENFDDSVARIASYIRERRIDSADGPNWTNWTGGTDGGTPEPVSLNLYDGLAGITIFLASFAKCTDAPDYRCLAEEVFDSMCSRALVNSNFPDLGAYNGWGGLIYTITFLGRLWERPELFNLAEQIAREAPDVICDEGLDIISGAAGWIGALTALWQCYPSNLICSLADRAGEHLLSRAVTRGNALVWPTKQTKGRALTGFSHGNAGIAWALARLFQINNDQRFWEASQRALLFERQKFCPLENNWPDFRAIEQFEPTRAMGKEIYSIAWCHGAPGIGLSRLIFEDHDSEAKREIQVAINSIKTMDCSQDHSLCHGALGNLDLLIELRDLPSGALRERHEDLASIVASMGEDICDQVARGKWKLGTPNNIASVGLMSGFAGIGYQLLRIAHPGVLPSLLSLGLPQL